MGWWALAAVAVLPAACGRTGLVADRFGAEVGADDADRDPDDAAEGLCAHMEGLMILAKARNQPAVLERLRLDGRRLVGLPVDASGHRQVTHRRSRAASAHDTQLEEPHEQ